MSIEDSYFITCEHGGNRIPAPYLEFFKGKEALLHSHRGYDAGALRLAREMSEALSAPLLVSTVSRLLVDLNRSQHHSRLFSEATRPLPDELRREILTRYYLPYRTKAEAAIEQAVARGQRVIHISSHSFTPELDGKVRNADIGLLYDPARENEAMLCRRWQIALKEYAAGLRSRMNYPYAGTSDGFTVYLRKRFLEERYLGIELEVIQKHFAAGMTHWRAVRHAIIQSLHAVITQD